MYYKLLTPSLFPQYDKILLTDVDVVFRGDISRDFMTFDIDSQYYVAGVGYNDIPSPSLQKFLNRAQAYQLAFGPENVKKFLIGAGYLIFNLTKMRKDNIEEKFTRCLQENIKRLGQPEQDVINLCCAPYIKLLPVSSWFAPIFTISWIAMNNKS